MEECAPVAATDSITGWPMMKNSSGTFFLDPGSDRYYQPVYCYLFSPTRKLVEVPSEHRASVEADFRKAYLPPESD